MGGKEAVTGKMKMTGKERKRDVEKYTRTRKQSDSHDIIKGNNEELHREGREKRRERRREGGKVEQ